MDIMNGEFSRTGIIRVHKLCPTITGKLFKIRQWSQLRTTDSSPKTNSHLTDPESRM